MEVLDMSKIEEGGLVLNHEPFDLIRYEKETQMLIDMQAQKNGIVSPFISHRRYTNIPLYTAALCTSVVP